MFREHTPQLVKKIFPDMIWNFPDRKNELFLSFDDGPTPEITEKVLEILKVYQAKATFFCLGKNAEQHPEIFQKILEQGHSVGNHTYSHLNGWKTPTEEYLQDIELSSSIFKSSLFRPPYGKMKPQQIQIIKKTYHIVLWEVLSADFDRTVSKDKCLKNVLHFSKDGSIIVFHDSIKASKNMLYVLPHMLNFYTEKGKKFSSINMNMD
ncbi:polysaccharide deacetylase family protein [Bacteroidota bacterium]